MTNEIVLFENQGVKLEVNMKDETVWLNREQISRLFNRDIKTIGKHINNALKEELDKNEVVAKFATTTKHGAIKGKTQTHMVDYYNLDMIISVGYRVKSKNGIIFRKWATNILKDYNLTISYNDDDSDESYKLDEGNIKVLKGEDKDYFVLLIKKAHEFVDGSLSPVIVNDNGDKLYEITYPDNTGIIVSDSNSILYEKGHFYIDKDKMYFIKIDCNDTVSQTKESILTVSNNKVSVTDGEYIDTMIVGGSICPVN